MIICVTGTPGTGKTTLAKRLAKELKIPYLDLGDLVKKHKLHIGYDRKTKSYVVDTKKMLAFLSMKGYLSKPYILDSHLSHEVPSKDVHVCVVTKCDIKELERRLKKRKYSVKKVRENLDAEIFDVCLEEAKEHGHKVISIDTTKGIKIAPLLKRL